MPGVDRFGVLITEDCHRFKITTPTQLTAAVADSHPGRIPRPMLDAIASESERFGPRRALHVVSALLMLAGLHAREVAALASLAEKSAWNMASLGRQALARRGQQEGDVEWQVRRMAEINKAEAQLGKPVRKPHRRKSGLDKPPPAGESP